MKPIVIYLDRRDGKVELTRKEFEDYINRAYQQGYDCGYAEGKKNYWSPWYGNGSITCTSNNTRTQPPITINPTPNVSPFTYDTQITCEAHNDIGETKCVN